METTLTFEEDKSLRHKSVSTKVQYKDTIADQIYEEVEKMDIMVKSEIWDENILWIWGSKFPNDKTDSEKVIHHALLILDNLVAKGKFRIIYFHSDVKGAGKRIPKLIKSLCGNMSKSMRSKMRSWDIVHPNFTLKVSLFFFDKITLTNYKIHYYDCLEDLYENLESDQKTFVLASLPTEVRLFDSQLSSGSSYVDSSKKQVKKVIVSSGESKYLSFDADTAVQTYDIIGKHIYEFKRSEGDNVPEIFQLVFNYFEQNEEYIKTEGVFRLAANKDVLSELETKMNEGEYDYLTTVEDPLTVGVYLKKLFREMGEPLCTYDLYTKFKDINDEHWKDNNEKIEMAKELLDELPDVNKDTFRALLNFLYMFTEYQEFNKMKSKNLAIVFAPNLFRAFEVTPNDMIYAQVLVKTLELMIDYCR